MNGKRRLIEGWIDKAFNQLQVAKNLMRSPGQSSESIQAAQECIELSVKSVLSLLDVNFPSRHGWEQDKKQFADIAKQIQDKQLQYKLAEQYASNIVNIPRLLFLVNFWAQFYITAKYGYETGYLAPAKDLFKKEEAEIAVQHANECYQAATYLIHLSRDRFEALIAEDENQNG